MTRALLLAVAMMAFTASPALASGDTQKPGCGYKFASHKCDTDGDKIVVVEEPAGANCPAGGVKIIVFKDDHDYNWKGDQSHHKVFFVCNGEPGAQGAPGPPGAPGENGTGVNVAPEPAGANCANAGIKVTPVASDGTLGTPFYVCNGATGPTGPAGAPGPPGATGPQGAPGTSRQLAICRSRRIGHWQLVIRNRHRVRSIRASVEGVRAPFSRNVFRGRRGVNVRVNLRGLTHGIYVARVRYRVSINGGAFFRNTQVHFYRVCYGPSNNPLGGRKEGPNRYPVSTM